MFKLMDKKRIAILHKLFMLNWPYGMVWSICTYELDSELVSGIGTGCSCTGGLCTVEAVNTLDSAN